MKRNKVSIGTYLYWSKCPLKSASRCIGGSGKNQKSSKKSLRRHRGVIATAEAEAEESRQSPCRTFSAYNRTKISINRTNFA